MNKNLGSIDRVLRIVLGIAIIVYGILESTWLGAIGGIPLLTAIIAWCPLYVPFKLTTCSREGCCTK